MLLLQDHKRNLRWAALGLASASALAPTEDSVALAFTPDQGSSRATRVRAEHSMDGGELSVIMGGSAVPDMYLPELYLEMTDVVTLEVVDTFSKASERGPSEWLRHYVLASQTNEGNMTVSSMGGAEEDNPWSADAETELAGSVVRFWGESGDAAREVVEGVDGDWISELRADLGFGRLFPADPVAVGDTWTLDDDVLSLLIDPTGKLGLEFDAEAAQYLAPKHDSEEFSGQVTLTLEALDDGSATIALDGEIVRVRVGPGDLSQVPVVDGTATDTTTDTFEVAGELTWDVANGGLVELTVKGAFTSETHTVRDEGQDGPTYESTFSVGGAWVASIEGEVEGVEAVEAGSSR